MSKLRLFGLVLAVAGCDHGSTSSEGLETPSASRIELRQLLPPGAVVVGATITPDGKRYVLDQRSGLYEIHDSSATFVFNTTGLNGVELTDVVALDSNRFALTAENDGFLFDVRTGVLSSYFCYLPSPPAEGEPMAQGGGPALPQQPASAANAPLSISQTLQLEGVAVKQRTESVAFNANTRRLFAQPRTIRLDSGAVAGSELFVFEQGGGEPVSVLPMSEPSFIAGGMLVVPRDRLLLGARNVIYELTLDGAFTALRELNVDVDVSGMALDPSGGVWILDGAAQQLTKLEGEL